MIDPQIIYSLVVGSVLVPNIVSIVVRSHWAGWLKAIVVILTSLVVGTVTVWANGQIANAPVTLNDWVEDVFAVGAAAIAAYKAFWAPTGIGPALEAHTQPTRQVTK